MDAAPIAIGVVAINVGVFLAGCAVAAYRTWRDARPTRRRRASGHLTAGRPSH